MTATWFPAVAHQSAQAAQINQFLTGHVCQYLYDGASVASNAAGSGTVESSSWVAQSFTLTGVTTVGRVEFPLAHTGSVSPVTVALYTNSGGLPGTLIVAAQVPLQSASGVISVPLPATGLTSGGTYWLVMEKLGASGNDWQWTKGTAGSGAATSTNGTSWTTQAYSMEFTVYDQSVSGDVRHIVYDGDPTSRWIGFDYTAGLVTAMRDSVGSGVVASALSLAYTSGQLTGASTL